MRDEDRYSVEGARAAARRGELREFVCDFLASEGSDNGALAAELTARLGCWWGPVRVPLGRLHRLAGPPGDPVICPVDEDEWRDDVEDLEVKVEHGWDPPPVVASVLDGELYLEDGNHRVEGVRRAGEREIWTVIGFEDPDALERFRERWPSTAT
jgi:hypothetical protein